MNVKKILLPVGIVLLFALAVPLRAQTGCEDSPEDPTLVLGLLAGLGALATGVWAARFRKRG